MRIFVINDHKIMKSTKEKYLAELHMVFDLQKTVGPLILITYPNSFGTIYSAILQATHYNR